MWREVVDLGCAVRWIPVIGPISGQQNAPFPEGLHEAARFHHPYGGAAAWPITVRAERKSVIGILGSQSPAAAASNMAAFPVGA